MSMDDPIKAITSQDDNQSLNQSSLSAGAADPFSLEKLLEKVKDECGFSDEEFEQCGIEITKTAADRWSANFTKKLPLVCDEKQQLVTLVKQAFEKNKTMNKTAGHFSESLKSLLTEKYPDGRGAQYCRIIDNARASESGGETHGQVLGNISRYKNLVNNLLATRRGCFVFRLFSDRGPAYPVREGGRDGFIKNIAGILYQLRFDSASTSQKTQQAAPAEQRTQCSR